MPPQQPKPPDLDEQGNPVTTQPPDLDEYGFPIEPEPTSMWDNPTWKAISQPPEFVTKGAERFADWITTPELDDWKATAMLKGFAGGAVQGASQFLNPLDIAGIATGVGEYNAARRGLGTLAKALKWGERATSAPIAVHGFERLTDPTSSLGEKAAGVAELAGGAYGAFGPRTPVVTRGRAGLEPSGAARPSGEPPTGPSGPVQGRLPLEGGVPAEVNNQQFLPYDFVEPQLAVRPSIRPSVAEAVAKPAAAETMLDVEGPKGLEADLTTIEGIQKAYAEGKLDRESALRNMQKVHRKLLVKPEPEAPAQKTATTIEEGQEIVFDPETGEIISGSPYQEGIEDIARLQETGEVKNVKELQQRTGMSFEDTRTLWYQAKDYRATRDAAAKAGKAETTAQVPLMITRQMEADLRLGGFTTEQINAMKPQEAWDILNAKSATPIADEVAADLKQDIESPIREVLPKTISQLVKSIPFTGNPEFDNLASTAKRLMSKGGLSDSELNILEDTVTKMRAHSSMPRKLNTLWDIIGEENKRRGPLFKPGDKVKLREPSVATGKPTLVEPQGETIVLSRAEADKTLITSLRKDGFELERLDDQGNYIFRRSGEAPPPSKGAMSRLLGGESQKVYDPETGLGGMGIPRGKQAERDVIEIFRGTIAGSTPQVAGKELIQNALDAADLVPGGQGKVAVEFNRTNRLIRVVDNGPGIQKDKIWTDYLDLTGSGKRGGEQKTIGELGVGKIAYLTKGERFTFLTVVREADGKLYQHKLSVTPEEVLDHKVNIDTIEVPEGSQTGVWTELKVNQGDKWHELTNYLTSLKKFSKTKVPVAITEKYPSTLDPGREVGLGTEVIKPSQLQIGRIVGEGSSPGGTFRLSIPSDATEVETNKIEAILSSRGMFQGVQTIYTRRKAKVPDRILVEVEPTVKGTHEDYPLTTPTRESLRPTTYSKVWDMIDEKLVEGAAAARELELQRTFHQMVPQPGQKFILVDPEGKFTPDELAMIANSPEMAKVAEITRAIADDLLVRFADELPDGKAIYSSGYILDPEVRGMNVRNPHEKLEHSLMINPINVMKSAKTPREAAQSFVHVTMHEFCHMMAWEEGAGFTSAFANVYTRYPIERMHDAIKKIERALTRGTGQYPIEVSELLRQGIEAGRRTGIERPALIAEEGSKVTSGEGLPGIQRNVEPGGGNTLRDFPRGKAILVDPAHASVQVTKKLYQEGFRFVEEVNGKLKFVKEAEPSTGPILEEEVGSKRPTTRALRGQLGAIQDAQKSNIIAEAFNFPRGVMASWDMSAPLRQGLPLVHKKEFWTALEPMMRSWASEEGFQASQAAIANRPLFKKRPNPTTGKVDPSFADDAGLKLTDLVDLSSREEAIMSTWAEKVPGVRRSNRAYTAFLNNLRADVFENLIKDAGILGGDPKTNLPLARAIADFVNTATGRGKLAVDIPKFAQKAFGGRTELSLESSATLLNTTLFAPRLIASRVKMLNPLTYMMAPPQVRKEYVKSLLALTAFGSTILGLAKMAGAEVSLDPTNSDFMKAKIGNVRIDPWAGFQQYAVLFSRMISGKSTSSTSGKEYNLFEKKGPFDPTHEDVMKRFLRGKTNPVINFAWGLADAQREMSGRPMQFGTPNPFENSITQRFIPIFVQDIYQIAQESPELLPMLAPAAGLGMGVQVYDNPGNQFYRQ